MSEWILLLMCAAWFICGLVIGYKVGVEVRKSV
jgi:hypothetical protein